MAAPSYPPPLPPLFPPSPSPPAPSPTPGQLPMPIAIGLGVGSVMMLFCVCAVFYCCVTRRGDDPDMNQLERVESTGQLHLGMGNPRRSQILGGSRQQRSQRADSSSERTGSSFRVGTAMCGITIHNQWTGKSVQANPSSVAEKDAAGSSSLQARSGPSNTTHI